MSLTIISRIIIKNGHRKNSLNVTFHEFLTHLRLHHTSDASYSYLSETNAHSNAGRHFFISNNDSMPSNNGAVLMISQIIKGVMPSVAEAEIQDLYINCRDAVSCPCLRDTLIHAGPYTTIHTNANGQKNIYWHGKQQRHEKVKGSGYELPLAPMQDKPMTNPPLMGGREVKQQWLCHQTACTNSSHKATKLTFSLQSPSYKNYAK